uniref:Variant surface glycoprotein 1125.5328 n=1 Tax=Trypanosoma brucei TaxID=5691 RepID=A0A1J0RC80_9TRYP|nr:variant surface glycoprotein 1125.5328 [Trypanosoma brucei]
MVLYRLTAIIIATVAQLQQTSSTHLGVQAADLEKACQLTAKLRAVAPSVGHKLDNLLAQTQSPTDIEEDLENQAQVATNAKNSDLRKLAVLTRNARIDKLKLTKSKTAAGVTAAARAAQLAGIIEKSANTLLSMLSGGDIACVSGTADLAAGSKAAIKLSGCNKDTTSHQPLILEGKVNKSINIKTVFEATKNGAAGDGSSGTTCKLLSNGGSDGPTATNAVKIMGGLLSTSTAAGSALTWNGEAAGWGALASTFGDADANVTAFNKGLQAQIDKNAKLLKLTETTEEEPPELEVTVGTYGDNQPASAEKISAQAINTVKKLIRAYRKKKT